jgi:hypothetical protein
MPSTENPLRNIEHSQERVCSASEVRVRSHFFVKKCAGKKALPVTKSSCTSLLFVDEMISRHSVDRNSEH